MYAVYILKSKIKESWSYVGSTGHLEQRFSEHCAGKVRSTKPYIPLEVVYTEMYDTRLEAYEREMYLKTGQGREEKQSILSALKS